VGEGRKATVRLEAASLEAAGKIDYVGPMADGRSRASLARIVLPNADGAWRPGLCGSVRVVVSEATVPVAVRPAALQTFRDWDVVFLQDGDVFQAMPVELGRRSAEWVEVLGGLPAGQRYANSNSFVIKAEVLKHGATHDH
jgi:membrane fusion protein, heavy metal efflux system